MNFFYNFHFWVNEVYLILILLNSTIMPVVSFECENLQIANAVTRFNSR